MPRAPKPAYRSRLGLSKWTAPVECLAIIQVGTRAILLLDTANFSESRLMKTGKHRKRHISAREKTISTPVLMNLAVELSRMTMCRWF